MRGAGRGPWGQWSAGELASAIAAREVSCEEVVGSAVERMRESNSAINAVVDDLGDDAMRLAKERDQSMRDGGKPGPLQGVPIIIKENIDQRGRATPNGVAAFANVIAPDDDKIGMLRLIRRPAGDPAGQAGRSRSAHGPAPRPAAEAR